MKRKLFSQIRHEWRGNLWLGIELLVVSVVLWYIFDSFVSTWQQWHLPNSYNTEKCFKVEIGDGGEEGDVNSWENRCNAVATLVDRMRKYPGVQYASLVCAEASIPHMRSFWGVNLNTVDDGKDSVRNVMVGLHCVDQDYFKVLRIPGIDGETPEEMSEKFRPGTIFLSDNVPFKYIPDGSDESWDYEMWDKFLHSSARELLGRRFTMSGDTIPRTVSGIIKPFKRMNFEYPREAVLLSENPSEMGHYNFILVRVFPENVADFKENVMQDIDRVFTVGNKLIRSVTSFDDIQRSVEAEDWKDIISYVFLMVFLLISIFLGLLGAFWFRTQQRVGEIAIRKVNGATNRQVFARLISEGLLILLFVTPAALVVDWLLTHYELCSQFPGYLYFEPVRFTLSALFSFLSLALMIVLGIWFPARKAMQVDPALALKDE